MVVRRTRVAAASAMALGTVAVMAGPAAADTRYSRTDPFGPCQVQSALTLLDSGSIRVSTTLVGPTSCEAGTAFARVTYVDDDGDPQETSAFGVESVTYTFEAPSASDVSSFHSVRYEEGCDPEAGTCQSPEYRLGSK